VRIAIVGAGAMGSVYAGLLASAGHEVWAVDRRADHVDAIRARGLRVEGASGDRTVRIDATTDAAEAGVAELVVLATKAMDVTAAAEAARPLVGPETLVLSIQNGLGGPDAAAAVLGDERVAVGVVGGFGASLVAPGHVHHHGFELVRLGERSGPVTPRIEAVAEVWRGAGFTVRTYDDVDRLVWEKLVCNVAFSAPCTVLGRTIGEVIGDDAAWAVACSCAVEAFEVARARGVELGFDDPVAWVRDFGLAIPGAKPSMLLDLEAGRRTEVDFINGAIPRAGREVGVAAPVNEALGSLVRALEIGEDAPVETIDRVLEELRAGLGADRVTLRRDLPGDYAFPVTDEALAPGVGSLRAERTVDLRGQPVVALLQRGEQVVQGDTRAAFDDPAFHRMLDTYGGLAAQIVTPIFEGGSLEAIVSLHVLGAPRTWSDADAAACREAADRVRELL
jgi:2-dehydropantoate 2-reductase